MIAHNLLPEVRSAGIALFGELKIPWHMGIGGGPGNHLLSSQVQCVNALGQMVNDPARIVQAFGESLGTEEVFEIEPGRYLTFEYIGPVGFFSEGKNGVRERGANCTSVDAAFVHRTKGGLRELVLLEYQQSIHRETQRKVGESVYEVRDKLLTAPDRFVKLDSAMFLDPAITSAEYVARYGATASA